MAVAPASASASPTVARVAGGAGAPSATARFATATGSNQPGSACASANPCSLTEAIREAPAGGEVVVRPGSYLLPDGLHFVNLYVHGVSPRERPVITVGATGQDARGLTAEGSTLSDVEIDAAPNRRVHPNTPSDVLFAAQSVLNRIIVRDQGAGDAGNPGAAAAVVLAASTAMSNSLVVQNAVDAVGVGSNGGGTPGSPERLVNSTVVASPASDWAFEIDFATEAKGPYVRNTILDAPVGRSILNNNSSLFDVAYSRTDPAAFGQFPFDHPELMNTQADPGFVSAANFHLKPTSSLISAGVANPVSGCCDLDGRPRITRNGVPDIGAYETAPCIVPRLVGDGVATARRIARSAQCGFPRSLARVGNVRVVTSQLTPAGAHLRHGALIHVTALSRIGARRRHPGHTRVPRRR